MLMVRRLPWHQLAPLYSQPHRVYHDLGHIHDLLSVLAGIELSPDKHLWMEAVVWLHDAYYDVSRPAPFNEYTSAGLLDTDLGLCFTDKGCQLARETILATAKHSSVLDNIHPLTQIFLDLDLSNLSYSRGRFLIQCQRVVEEKIKAGFSRHQAVEGVQSWAQGMLSRNTIFYTSEFSGFEKIARDNLAYLLENPTAASPRSEQIRT